MATNRLQDDHIKWILSLDAKGVQSELSGFSSKAQDLTQKNKELSAELKVVEKDADKLQTQMSKLAASGDTTSEKYERLRKSFNETSGDANILKSQIEANQRAIDQFNKKSEEIIKTMRVEDMTMDQLIKRAKELEIQKRKTSEAADPKVYAELETQLTAVQDRMSELNGGTKNTENTFSAFSSTVVKGLAITAAGVIAAKEAFGLYENVVVSNRATGTEFEATMNGVNEALDYTKTALATMDFTNFIDGFTRAFTAGKAASKMLDELFDRQNSFDLTTAPVKAEIEELKTQLRDVNQSEADRVKIADEIIAKTKDVSNLQKEIIRQEVEANEIRLDGQLSMTKAEKEYIIVNYNKNIESIRFAKELIELEKQRNHEWDLGLKTMSDSEIEKNYYLRTERNLIRQIELMKQSAEFSETAYSGMTKYQNSSKDLVKSYVDATKKALDVDIQTNRELRMTERLRNSLLKSGNLLTDEMKKFNSMTDKELKEWIKKSEDASEEFNKNIASAFDGIRSNWDNTEGFLNKMKGAFSGFTNTLKENNKLNEYTNAESVNAAKAVWERRHNPKAKKAGESAEQKEIQRQKKELNKLNEELEITHKKKLTEINLDYLSGKIKTEADFKREQFSKEQTYYLLQEEALKEFIDKTTKEEVKRDASKQLAVVQEKMLAQQIKYRKEIEKIILDADPVEKEKRAFQERLSAIDLFNVERKDMTADQLKALELLEKQHQDNLDKIEKAGKAKKKADAEASFQESFSKRKEEMQIELNELTSQAATLSGNAAFEAEMAVHVQKLKMIQEEIDARRKAGAETTKQVAEIGKIESQLTATLQKENLRRINTYNQYATTLGTATGEVLAGQKSAFEAFGSSMIDILFDIVSQIINTKIVEATAVAVAEQAKAAAIAAALPDSVLTFGATAAARTAAIGAIIMGALQVAKSALKGMIGKKSSSSSPAGSGGSTSTGSVTVKQKGFADGGFHGGYTGEGSKYDIKGFFPDGEPYHAKEYIIPREELKIPAVQEMVRSIETTRQKRTKSNPLPVGFADGGFHGDDPDQSPLPFGMNPGLMKRFIEVMEKLDKKEFKANLGITEYQAKLDDMNKENNRFKK